MSSSVRIREPNVLWTKVSSLALSGVAMDAIKTWINRPLEETFFDMETQGLVLAAQRAIEQRCRMSLARTVWAGTAWGFPVKIMQRPFVSVDKVEYVDPSSGEVLTADPATYVSAPDLQFMGQLLPSDRNDWPDIANRPDAVRLTVTAGFGDVIPNDIMHALLMTVANLDLNRGDVMASAGHLAQTVYGQTHSQAPNVIPQGAMALLGPYIYRQINVA